MAQCTEMLASKVRCKGKVMLEPDFSVEPMWFLKDKKVSTISWPLKPAKHGLCFYHMNKQRKCQKDIEKEVG